MPSDASGPTKLYQVPPEEKKPDVIALHGFIQTLESWRYLVPKLAERGKKVCTFDLKGHGRSPAPADGRYSLEDHAAPILAFIRDNDLRDLTLVGHSFGGSIALLLAIRLMEEGRRRLRSLVLVDSLVSSQALRIRLLRAFGLLVGPIASPILTWDSLAELAVKAGFMAICRHPGRIDADAVKAYAANLRQPERARALIQTGRQITPEDYVELQAKLSTIDVPTLIVWGRQDQVVPFASGEALQRQLPHARLFPVEDCGHIPQEEQPEIVVDKIAAFVADPAAPI